MEAVSVALWGGAANKEVSINARTVGTSFNKSSLNIKHIPCASGAFQCLNRNFRVEVYTLPLLKRVKKVSKCISLPLLLHKASSFKAVEQIYLGRSTILGTVFQIKTETFSMVIHVVPKVTYIFFVSKVLGKAHYLLYN